MKQNNQNAENVKPEPPNHLMAALSYARQGLKIFPILEGTKDTPLVKWGDKATSDEATIKQWWTRWPNANIGLAFGPSNIAVVDVDIKNGGQGPFTLAELSLSEGCDLTLTRQQRTPSGGLHHLYKGQLPNTVGKIGPGVDTRGGAGSRAGGYILLPPSSTEVGRYAWLNREPIAAIDQWVIDKCGTIDSAEAVEQEPLVEWDLPSNVERAKHWLQNHAPTSRQGEGGDTVLVTKVVPILKDWAISEEMAAELLIEFWNDRCQPPWNIGGSDPKNDLLVKIHNAYLYCRERQPGIDTPQNDFAEPYDDTPRDRSGANDNDPPDDPTAETPRRFKATPFEWTDPKKIPPRDWLYGTHYIRRLVVADVAPGAAGKTSNAIVEALSMATGVDLLRAGRMYPRPLKVWIINLEDDKQEMARRVTAAVKHYSTAATEDEPGDQGEPPLNAAALQLLASNLRIDTAESIPLKIAVKTSDHGMKIALPVVKGLIAEITEQQIDVLIIDPFISSHEVNENDNVEIDRVIKDGWLVVARDGNCAVGVIHHMRKGRPGVEAGYTAADARGASASVDAFRDVRVFNAMSEAEAELFHIPMDVRWRYIRLDKGKPNMSERTPGGTWRYLESVSLDNPMDGRPPDIVGVVSPWSPPDRDPVADDVMNAKIMAAVRKLFDEDTRITKTSGNNSIKNMVPQLQTLTGIAALTGREIKRALDAAEASREWRYRTSQSGERAGRAGYCPAEPGASASVEAAAEPDGEGDE
jgi:hypothetical protein